MLYRNKNFDGYIVHTLERSGFAFAMKNLWFPKVVTMLIYNLFLVYISYS